jgi:peptidoglycan/LPS O-acetylase OafA/YrhL
MCVALVSVARLMGQLEQVLAWRRE